MASRESFKTIWSWVDRLQTVVEELVFRAIPQGRRAVRIPIVSKLILSFLLVISTTSLFFSLAGIHLIDSRIVAEAQQQVRTDLNTAREIYTSELNHISYVVRFTSDRYFLADALASGNVDLAAEELARIRKREGLDVLTITDKNGKVLLRANNGNLVGDDVSHDPVVSAVIKTWRPIAATTIVSAEDLRKESPLLAERARFVFIDTPKARARPETEETSGMMLKAAAPILDREGRLIGVIYGGVLLNRNFEIVDKIKRIVFQDVTFDGREIGTSTIFQDDVRIATNVLREDGSRAIGTRAAEEVYNQVVGKGMPWIGRAYVVHDWYITAYEPIRDLNGKVIGILYVGVLEAKYIHIKKQTFLIFLAITFAGALLSMALSYFLSRRISGSVRELMSATHEVTRGNFDVKVEITTHDELGELAERFNLMAAALKARDERLREFATSKIMESERLALIGQLAANVAHELNNPLQGIVTYSHLLLERMPPEGPSRDSIQKIAHQANRCTSIIRGLLDFSRQRAPHKTLVNVNAILLECISLVEDQAIFHNIEVTRELDEDLPLVVADPSQIQQVFMNLIINAAEAMNGVGRLSLRTRLDPTGNYIETLVSDTGHGIRKEDMDRIFDPFFTTKDVGHGVGLGLAISYGIIKEHEGMILVESEVGKGTTFTVRLPLTAEKEG